MANLGFLNFLSGATQGYAGAQQQQQQMRADQRQQYLQMLQQQQQAMLQHAWDQQQALQQHLWEDQARQADEAFQVRLKGTPEGPASKGGSSPANTPHMSQYDIYDLFAQQPQEKQRWYVRNFNTKYHTNFPLPGEVRNGIHVGFYDTTPYDVLNKVVDSPSGFAPAYPNPSSGFAPAYPQTGMPPHFAIEYPPAMPYGPSNPTGYGSDPVDRLTDMLNPYRAMPFADLVTGGYH
jgi:hypothetical protein